LIEKGDFSIEDKPFAIQYQQLKQPIVNPVSPRLTMPVQPIETDVLKSKSISRQSKLSAGHNNSKESTNINL
jgi:hypothetical protein